MQLYQGTSTSLSWVYGIYSMYEYIHCAAIHIVQQYQYQKDGMYLADRFVPNIYSTIVYVLEYQIRVLLFIDN
jgi:hypothetical protein